MMGAEKAAVMMDLLPPVGWADIATKRDLDALEARFESKLEAKLAGLQSELLIKLFFGMVASNATLVGLVLAAIRLG